MDILQEVAKQIEQEEYGEALQLAWENLPEDPANYELFYDIAICEEAKGRIADAYYAYRLAMTLCTEENDREVIEKSFQNLCSYADTSEYALSEACGNLAEKLLSRGCTDTADRFLFEVLYDRNREAAKIALSERNMVLKILTEILLCEKRRGVSKDSYQSCHGSYRAFFAKYQTLKRLIRRIWFGFSLEEQREISTYIRKEPVSSDCLAVIARYSVPPGFLGDLFQRMIGLLSEDHPSLTADLKVYLQWFQKENMAGKDLCREPMERQDRFTCRVLSYQKEGGAEPASQKETDPSGMAVIFCTNEEGYAAECKRYLQYLRLPEDIRGEILEIHGAPGMAAGYNFAMSCTDAKYKIYIHHDTLLIDPNLPVKLVTAFRKEETLGLLGAFGSEILPESGKWYQAPYEKSVLTLWQDAILQFLVPKKPEKTGWKTAEAIDGAFLATAQDVQWQEDRFPHWHFYDIAQCMEMKRKGLQVALYEDQTPWLLHESTLRKDPEMQYEKYCRIFLEYYQKS